MKRILFVIALVAIAVIEFLLWINALVDGKYLVEGSGVEDVYNLRVESLSVAMFVNYGIVLLLASCLIYRKKK
ncbi:hypothetical protein SAMN05216518_1338 [Bacteroidales bacterium KHT7]|nr:hypothetical protein SAMN05216518_1338 [Bacteroidales bacterium KHT7]